MKKKSDTLQQKVFLILDIKSNRKGILIMNALDVKKNRFCNTVTGSKRNRFRKYE